MIVTARKPGKAVSLLPNTPEEHRRGEAADTLWRELVRRVRAG